MKITCKILFLILLSTSLAAQQRIVLFESDQYVLNTDAIKQLDLLIADALDAEAYSIELVGHTDNTASDVYNQNLSEKRVKQVFNYLTGKKLKQENIKFYFKGESSPVADNDNNFGKSRNRRVEIFLKKIKSENQETSNKNETKILSKIAEQKFESDTSLEFQNGTVLEMESGTFYPYKIKDIKFEVEEVFSLCDMLNNNITTHTEDGNCLTSGGMVFIKATLDTVAVHPVKGKYIRIKIPLKARVFDKDMQLYLAKKNNDGSVKWKYADADISYVEGENRYYEFKTDTLLGFNLDKQFMARCEDNGPLVKIPRLKNVKMFLTYKNELYLSKGLHEKNRRWSLACVDSLKVPVLTVTGVKNGKAFVASGPLFELKYKKRKKMYILPKKFLHLSNPAGGNSTNSEDALCRNFYR